MRRAAVTLSLALATVSCVAGEGALRIRGSVSAPGSGTRICPMILSSTTGQEIGRNQVNINSIETSFVVSPKEMSYVLEVHGPGYVAYRRTLVFRGAIARGSPFDLGDVVLSRE